MDAEQLLAAILGNDSTRPQLVEENPEGSRYNVIRQENQFFAIHQAEGAFNVERARRGEYTRPVFIADTLGEMHAMLSGKQSSPQLKVEQMLGHIRALEGLVAKLCRFVPPGHYYSPINSEADVLDHGGFDRSAVRNLPGIAFPTAEHESHLRQMADEYHTLPPFPQTRVSTHRYYYQNDEQWYFDAVAMRHFMGTCRPKRVIEVGCGYSSSVMLDAADALGTGTTFTFIEPHPERFLGLVRDKDLKDHTLIREKVQHVPLSLFEELEPGDILFVDSSHVSKFVSDVNHYTFEILPRLKSGVYVHIHDIGYPFEYPQSMLDQGRSWNEAYMVRAFLMFNSAFRIEFWSAYASHFQAQFLEEKMPLCRQWPGGALWLRRDSPA